MRPDPRMQPTGWKGRWLGNYLAQRRSPEGGGYSSGGELGADIRQASVETEEDIAPAELSSLSGVEEVSHGQ
jgi:hypothetical protein